MSAEGQIKAFIDRVLRLKEEQDTLSQDIRDVYAEAKSMGFDKTAMGEVVGYLRKLDKKGRDAIEERGAIFDTYLAAYERPSHTHAREGVVSRTEEATVAAQDEATVSHSDQRETDREAAATGVGANEGGEDVESSAERAGLNKGPVNLEPSGPEAERATSFTVKPPSPLRPHCRQPEACGGYGRNHCHTCAKATREQEELA